MLYLPLLHLTTGIQVMLTLCRQAPFGRMEVAINSADIPHSELRPLGFFSVLNKST